MKRDRDWKHFENAYKNKNISISFLCFRVRNETWQDNISLASLLQENRIMKYVFESDTSPKFG